MNHPRATAPSSPSDNEPWIYKKGPAFGMPGVHVDGMDVLKVGRVGGSSAPFNKPCVLVGLPAPVKGLYERARQR